MRLPFPPSKLLVFLSAYFLFFFISLIYEEPAFFGGQRGGVARICILEDEVVRLA